MTFDLSIIIVTYKSRAYIERCLAALTRHAPRASHEVFVVDNASGDGTAQHVAGWARTHGHITLLQNTQNEGFARANNRAIQQARGRYILLLNPDTEVTAGALDALVAEADRLNTPHPADSRGGARRFGALAPRLQYPDGSFQPNFYRFPSIWAQIAKLFFAEKLLERRVRAGGLVPVDCAWGAALLFERTPRAGAGPTVLDKNIFLYSEDLELCWRLARQNQQTYVLGSAVVVHAHNKSGEQLYGGARASRARLQEFKKTLRYVTRRYWRGPLKTARFWIYCQLEALNASWRALFLRTLARRRFAPPERAARLAEHATTARVFSGRAQNTPLTTLEKTILTLALALFLSLSTIIAVLLPRGAGNDEDSHTTYVRYVTDYGRLPQPFPIDFGVNREPHQPPLYYLAGATWLKMVRPLGLGTDSLRLFAILLGLVQLYLVFTISRLVLPSGWRVVPLLLFAALPMLAHEFATINDDGLAFIFVSLLTLALVHLWRRSDSARARSTAWYLVAALAGSAAVLSKLFAAPAVLVLGLAITLLARRAHHFRIWLGTLLIASIPLIAWLIFNYHQTGLVLPEVHLGELPELAPYRENVTWNYALSFVVVLWQTFVGRYGSWTVPLPDLLYVAYLVPIALGVAGAVHLQTTQRLGRRLTRWMAAAFLAELAGLAYLNRDYFQPQARYLYPIVGGLLVVLTLGLRRTLSLKTTVVLLTTLGLLSVLVTPFVLRAFFA
ncbi:MAG: glycosyltransferase [Candidatus Andersenbacteria bacterium]